MLFIEYKDLPDAVYGRIARHFRLELDAEDLARMRERTRFDSKSGFLWSDGEPLPQDGRRAASVRELYSGKLAELYAALQQASQIQLMQEEWGGAA